MKFNEKEIAYFALTPAPDREGLLEKKGAGLGQGEAGGKEDPWWP